MSSIMIGHRYVRWSEYIVAEIGRERWVLVVLPRAINEIINIYFQNRAVEI